MLSPNIIKILKNMLEICSMIGCYRTSKRWNGCKSFDEMVQMQGGDTKLQRELS